MIFFDALTFDERHRVTELYTRHGHSVLRRARRILGSESEAEEVMHELFMRIAENPKEVDRAKNELAWLYGATTHACLNRLRNQRNRVRLLDERAEGDEAQHGDAEAAVTVAKVLAEMPKELAEVLVYYHVDQMSHAEIAEVVNCSRRHVGDLLLRADEWAARHVRRGMESAS